jgi:predicted deacylase
MSDLSRGPADGLGLASRPSRLIAHLRGTRPGPTLILVGGVHGNEPAGIIAARSVLGDLTVDQVAGEVIALVGNARAVGAAKRFIDRDLNRMWTPERVATARARHAEPDVSEHIELAELADAIDRIIERAAGPVHVVDLHTTSADGVPFVVVGASDAHRTFASHFPLPGIAGLEEALEGVLTRYLGGRGCITLAVEGGQSATTQAAANLEATVTLALEASGVVEAMPGAAAAREHLARVRGDLPAAIEVVSRHHVDPDSGFVMEPGFANIQRVTGGTLLARERDREIRAPFDGVVLLPLYQPQGEDGFFFGSSTGG